MLKIFRNLAVLALLVLAFAPWQRLEAQTMIEPHAQAMPLLPFLDYFIDQSLGMDIEEVSRANGWQPLLPDRLPLAEGVVWLRFTIAPLAPDARPQTFLLDFGQSVPGVPALFDPVRNELSGAQEWRENLPPDRNIVLLPEAAATATPCYIRINGLPGPWFAPMIRTPQNAASNWSSLAHAGSILALGVIMALCLLRGLAESGQWRYWIALFVGAALLQAWLGLPALTGGFSLAELGAVLLPGIALMLLPHAGRHLMQARKYSRAIDLQLFLLSLPGAILALLPLVPGWDWLYRWLDLWPLGTLIFIPTALAAWLAAIPGARRFLLACCIPPLFTAIAWFGLDFGLPANVLASGPAWGIFFAALILAASLPALAAAPQPEARQEQKPAKKKKLAIPDLEGAGEEIINLEHPMDDPNLRLIPSPARSQESDSEKNAPPALRRLPRCEGTELEIRENAMRDPLDELLRESANLERCALPPSARQNVENVIAAAEKLASILSNMPLREQRKDIRKPASFNLQRIIRNAHDSVMPGAEYAGIALSWYLPPHLPQMYEGDAEALQATLSMLLESSIRSAHHGAIKISARRVPDSPDPGHLLFTITDTGSGFPPLDRSSLALARAWELTGACGGYLSMESSQHGATIAFTAHFTPLEEPEAGEETFANSRVMLVGDDEEAMRTLARIIATLPCELEQAGSEQEAIEAQAENAAVLLITTGKFSRPAASDMVRKFVRIARDKGLACHVLAITPDESEWRLLKASGFTHAMLEPVDPENLKRTIMELTELAASEEAADSGDTGPIKTDQAPSMLIEQDFAIAQAFEGPDWLGDQREDFTPVQEEPLRPVESKAPANATEWVGEPTPIIKSPCAPAKPAQEAREQEKPVPPRDVAQPAVKTPAPAAAGESAMKPANETGPIGKKTAVPDEEGELLDFVLDIKDIENKSEAKAGGPAREAAVRDFVEGSASMVADALAGMLNPEKKAKPAQEPLQARSDPAIVSLLERLDAAMRQADAAFSAKNCPAIANSAGLIAGDAETFGLRLLARMASCVEKAAAANDMTALSDLLPELGNAIERNRITLAQRKS